MINSQQAKKVEDELLGERSKGTIYRDITSDEVVKEQDDAIRSALDSPNRKEGMANEIVSQVNVSSGSTITDYFNQFGPDTLLGAMMKPRSEGGVGFPFASAPSTFSPEGSSNGLSPGTWVVGQGYKW